VKFNTESLARWASRKPWTVIGIWAILCVAALVSAGTLLGDAITTEAKITNKPESIRADNLLSERLGESDTTSEIVIVRSGTLTVDDPAFQGYVEGLFADFVSLGNEVVLDGAHYYSTHDESLVSADRHATLIMLTMPEEANDVVDQVHRVIDDANKDNFQVLITGDATMSSDYLTLSDETLRTGEGIGISVGLVVLALVFGAIAAALLPIFLALVAVMVALGVAALIGQTVELSFFVTNMITMMGLAVGIDYSLFILSRYREERERGVEKAEAIAIAGSTASRAVLFSGMTVVLALFGLIIFPLTIFQSAGIGAITVVAVSVLASLTLLPAVLALLGDKVNAIRIPFIQRRKAGQGAATGGFWIWTTRTVTRRPVVSMVIAVSLLLAAVMPYFDGKMGISGVSSLPDGLRSKEGFVALQQDFGFGEDAPAVVVIDGQTDSPDVQAAVVRLEESIKSDPAFASSWMETHPEANLSVLSARLVGDPMGKSAMDAVKRLRSDYIPDAFASAPVEALVTGSTAGVLDFNHTTDTYRPIVFAFVLGLSFILLTLAFRSVVIPVMSILMNLLSVGAAYGLIVLVCQKGVGAGILGFQQVDVIESWLPLFLFAILFGLSMDYHVFLLSRIREQFGISGDNAKAVEFGLSSTGKLITGAALIMVAVFGGFALGDMVTFQQMGFGLAIAVFMDATIVRSVLVPSTMRLLGNLNWYFPTWLEWLPNVSIGEVSRKATKHEPGLAPAPELVPVQLESRPPDIDHRQ